MDKKLIKIRVEKHGEDSSAVHIPYLEFVWGAATTRECMDRYHTFRKLAKRVAGYFSSSNRLRENEESYEFFFVASRRDKTEIMGMLEKRKDNILEVLGKEKDLYEVEVV